eukprot:9472627-Pyramimonas_sp.AAC.1
MASNAYCMYHFIPRSLALFCARARFCQSEKSFDNLEEGGNGDGDAENTGRGQQDDDGIGSDGSESSD